jgi:hypothetical protein
MNSAKFFYNPVKNLTNSAKITDNSAKKGDNSVKHQWWVLMSLGKVIISEISFACSEGEVLFGHFTIHYF